MINECFVMKTECNTTRFRWMYYKKLFISLFQFLFFPPPSVVTHSGYVSCPVPFHPFVSVLCSCHLSSLFFIFLIRILSINLIFNIVHSILFCVTLILFSPFKLIDQVCARQHYWYDTCVEYCTLYFVCVSAC